MGNARQAAHYYRTAFGFRLAAYRGPETGTRDRASYVLEQDKIRFVLTTPLQPDGEIADHVRRHGDGVRDIALWVDDAEAAWRATTSRGARSVREPETVRDERGRSACGVDRDLWRHGTQFRGAPELRRRVPAGLRSGDRGGHAGAARGAASTSITWWATWAGAR